MAADMQSALAHALDSLATPPHEGTWGDREVSALQEATEACAASAWALVPLPAAEALYVWRERARMLFTMPPVWDTLHHVDCAGFDVPVHISREQVWLFWLPLAEALCALQKDKARVLAGVCGPPGSGKSTTAAILAAVLRARGVACAVVPQDGYHHYNAFLDTHTTTLADGARVPLRAVKGTPLSFDAAAFVRDVRALARGDAVDVRVYDRTLHDPAPQRVHVPRTARVLLLEGIFLLHDGDGFAPVRACLHTSVFLHKGREACERALLARMRRGGRSAEDSRAHLARVDSPNITAVLATAPRATVTVHVNAAHAVQRVHVHAAQ